VRAEAVLRRVREVAGPHPALIAAGGVMSPDDAAARIDAGANLVQLYTGFVFGGVGLVRRVAERVGGR
jgi:dihydroorotate dehydrogenase